MSRLKHKTPRVQHARDHFYSGSTLADGRKVKVTSDFNGKFKIQGVGSAPEVVIGPDGNRVVRFVPHTAEPKRILQAAKRAARRYGITEPTLEDIVARLEAAKAEQNNGVALQMTKKIDFRLVSIAATKIAYEFTADTLGEAYVADEGAAAFRQLILQGRSFVKSGHVPDDLITNGGLRPIMRADSPFTGLPNSTHSLVLVRDETGLRVKMRLFDAYEGAFAMTPNPSKFLKPGWGRIYFEDVATGRVDDNLHRRDYTDPTLVCN